MLSSAPTYSFVPFRTICRPLLAAALLSFAGCATVRPNTSANCPSPPASSDYREVEVIELTGTEPFESVCQLSVWRMYLWLGSYFKNSSAFLIGDDLLLTAAHNVHNGLFSRVRRAEAVCGRTRSGIMWPEPIAFDGQDTEVAEGYHFLRAPQHRDYALIRLPEPAAYPSSFRLLRPGDSELKKGETIYTAGHPSEPPLCMDRMHVASGRIVSEINPEDAFIDYDIETLGGNSGGPVWVKRDNDYVVVGVHISPGRARRLDAGALSDLEAWGVPVMSENSVDVLMPHGDERSGGGHRGAHGRPSVQLQRHGMAAQ